MNVDKLVAALIAAELRAAGARLDLLDLAGLVVGQAVKVDEVDGEAVLTIIDDKGNPRVGDLAGNLMSLPSYVAEFKASRRRAFMFGTPAKPDDKPQPQPENATEAAIRAKREADRTGREARQRERDAWPNPWMAGSFNLSRQMELENMNPARAKAAKAAAGVA